MQEQFGAIKSQAKMTKGRSFGQSEPLTQRLHGLIRSYPPGIGIFQEFIQNADDAGASWVQIVLDRRSFYGDQLPSPTMSELMGPSLMIYNDRVFSDNDLEGIQQIGMGSKGQQLSKTGRFGLGFNACYNVTDYPSFLTRESIYFFDPHCNVVEGATHDHPGRAWDLDSEVWQDYPELFRPFEILGLKKGQSSYPGTVFRLPMRTSEQATNSHISDKPFLEADFYQFLNLFIPLGADMLIFLKHVTRISVYEITSDQSELSELFDITTLNEEEVRENRDRVNRFVCDDTIQMIDALRNSRSEIPVVSFIHQMSLRTPDFSESQKWRVVNGLFVDDQQIIVDMVEKMRQGGEKAVPWAGAAVRLCTERAGSEAGIDATFQQYLRQTSMVE
jgi:hypothetical protein